MSPVEAGKTYLGVACKNCGKPAPFIEVEAGTKLGRLGGEFEIECVQCGHTAAYPARELHNMTVHRKQ